MNVKNRFVDILGIPMYALGMERFTQEVIDTCLHELPQNKCVSATDAHGLVLAQKDKLFLNTLLSMNIRLPDGMPSVWIGKWKGAKHMNRCYGPEVFANILKASHSMDIKHFLCGGREGVAELLKDECHKKFSNTNICGTYCPPFRSLEEKEFEKLGQNIHQSKANIIWIGLGTPKQEKFALALSKYTKAHFIITIGAAFDFHTGKVRQAPLFIQRSGFEWLFRLFMEPKRLFKRYAKIVPLFIYYHLKEFVTFANRRFL